MGNEPEHAGVDEFGFDQAVIPSESIRHCLGVGEPEEPDGVKCKQQVASHSAGSSTGAQATVPKDPLTAREVPSASNVMASRTPTTAGIPNSRATMAAWDNIPPV